MAIYGPDVIERLWRQNGGDPNKAIVACAVALAESGGDTTIVSTADDHGLWQINRMHFLEFGVNDSTVLDPNTNCQIAIRMSANGSNWGAWCSCYAPNDHRPCGSAYIAVPETGSPAAGQLARAAGGAGLSGPVASAAVASKALPRIEGAWASFAFMFGAWGRQMYRNITEAGSAMRGLIR